MSTEEIVDVVDREDRVVGTIPRGSIASSGANHRVVHILVLDRSGRLLMQRPSRALGRSFELGSSVAGHVRSGESYEAAARREFEEELGLKAPELLDLGTTWLYASGRRKFIGVFIAHSGGPFTPDRGEVEAIEWIPLPTLRDLMRREPSRFSDTFRRVVRHADANNALHIE